MKKYLLHYSMFFTAVLCCPFSLLADSDTTIASISTSITADITLKQEQSLSFGRLLPGNKEGVVRVTPAGTEVKGGVTVVADGQPGKFVVQGLPGFTYNVTLPADSFDIRSGSYSMPVKIVTSLRKGEGILDGSGESNFFVNGQLEIDANQHSGVYRGTYPVAVDY